MHPIQSEFILFTYEDSDVDGVLGKDFTPLDRLAALREMH